MQIKKDEAQTQLIYASPRHRTLGFAEASIESASNVNLFLREKPSTWDGLSLVTLLHIILSARSLHPEGCTLLLQKFLCFICQLHITLLCDVDSTYAAK